MPPGRCRFCRCSHFKPCPSGCGWANSQQTLCTACIEIDIVWNKGEFSRKPNMVRAFFRGFTAATNDERADRPQRCDLEVLGARLRSGEGDRTMKQIVIGILCSLALTFVCSVAVQVWHVRTARRLQGKGRHGNVGRSAPASRPSTMEKQFRERLSLRAVGDGTRGRRTVALADQEASPGPEGEAA
jgi:hypothetical protein